MNETLISETIMSWFSKQDEEMKNMLFPFLNWEYLMDCYEYDDEYETEITELKEQIRHLTLVRNGEEKEEDEKK